MCCICLVLTYERGHFPSVEVVYGVAFACSAGVSWLAGRQVQVEPLLLLKRARISPVSSSPIYSILTLVVHFISLLSVDKLLLPSDDENSPYQLSRHPL